MSQDTDIDMLNNDTNNNNNNTHDIKSKTRSKTRPKKIHKAIGSEFSKFIDSQNQNSNNSPQDEQYLLQSALVILSKSFKEGIDCINKEIKIKNQLYQTKIDEINQNLFALSHQKKQYQIELAEYNKVLNNEIDQLSSYPMYFQHLLKKYEEAIKNRFTVSQISCGDDNKDNYICKHCNHSANNEKELNSHLFKHQQENNKILTSSQWKNHLIEIIQIYSLRTQDYQNEILDKMFASKEPLLPPSKPVNPQKVHNVPDYRIIDNHHHNKEVMQNYRKSIYPQIMNPEEIMNQFDTKDKAEIDHRDLEGRYLPAVILRIENDKKRKSPKFGITYKNWGDEWNTWCFINIENHRIAEHESISKRPLYRNCMQYIKLTPTGPWGQMLEVKPLHLYHDKKNKNKSNNKEYRQGYPAQVILNDSRTIKKEETIIQIIQSAQVKCILYNYNKHKEEWYLPKYSKKEKKWMGDIYWVHLDNEDECQPINTYFNFDLNQLQ